MAPETAQETLIGLVDGLRRGLAAYVRPVAQPAAIGLFVLGAIITIFWYATNDRSNVSLLLLLAGITTVAAAILLYFLSPSRFLRDDVADALALASFTDVGRVLASLMIEGRGVYVPASEAGTTRVFVPVGEAVDDVPLSGSVFVSHGSKGMLLDPPGSGLLSCAKQISPGFAEESLSEEIADLFEGGLELARKVMVLREGDCVTVSMSDLANAGLCAAVRRESPKLCTQIGCPICSFAACMIADGARRRVRIEGVEVTGKTVRATFRLL
ncbi:MAG TPA: hypothetical protein VLT35_06495 [Methanocella sp.]|nr:hypothetical protein [Methanocella sp.]